MRALCYAQLCSLRSGHGFVPCCEIWLLPEALWKSCFLLCPTTCKPPCWEKEGNSLNCVHLFLSLRQREKHPSKFFLLKREVGGCQYIPEDVLIVSEELGIRRTVTLAGTTNSVAIKTLTGGRKGERKPWIFFPSQEVPRSVQEKKGEV